MGGRGRKCGREELNGWELEEGMEEVKSGWKRKEGVRGEGGSEGGEGRTAITASAFCDFFQIICVHDCSLTSTFL